MMQSVALAVLVLASTAVAQARAVPPAAPATTPLPGLPMTAPPVQHPALLAQPLFEAVPRGPAGGGQACRCGPNPGPQPDPSTMGPQIGGKDLKKAVAKVNDLAWLDSLAEAKAQSAAHGKPILWLQALGDLEGFA